jgi:hypothetical protein
MPTIMLDNFTGFPQDLQKNEWYFVILNGAGKTSPFIRLLDVVDVPKPSIG